MNNTVPPVPLDLLRLRSATRAYLAILRDVAPFLDQVADVNALREPTYLNLRDEVRAARREDSDGSPARIARWLGLLLGETER